MENGLRMDPALKAVKSVVRVRFPSDGRILSYYNDSFILSEGDAVYVEGTMYGIMGIIESVAVKFRIRRSDYKRVIAKVSIDFRGEYERIGDKVVSFSDDAPDADAFRAFAVPPADDDDEIIFGEGHSFYLSELEEYGDASPVIFERAERYSRSGSVVYMSLKNGEGHAFVDGSRTYEVSFMYKDGIVYDLYCDCPYVGFCKHSIAAMIDFRNLLKELPEGTEKFTAVDPDFFWQVTRDSMERIVV